MVEVAVLVLVIVYSSSSNSVVAPGIVHDPIVTSQSSIIRFVYIQGKAARQK